jgi:DNA polymerase-3 subunit alpha
LDEYAFEIQKLCNIDSELLNLFAGWSKPEARTAADLPSDEEEQEGASKKITPQEFIKRYTNIPLRFGGIITSSEELVSKSNNPYGRYTIEDYSGHYTFVVFGSAYRQFAPLLKKDLYIQVSGSIQQRGHDFRGFVAKPANEAVYELNIKNVEMLKDVQDKQMTSLNILLPLYSISPEFMAELNDICNENPGNHQLKIKLINPLHSNSVQMFSRKYHVHIGRHFYNWLQEKQENNILFYRIE